MYLCEVLEQAVRGLDEVLPHIRGEVTLWRAARSDFRAANEELMWSKNMPYNFAWQHMGQNLPNVDDSVQIVRSRICTSGR